MLQSSFPGHRSSLKIILHLKVKDRVTAIAGDPMSAKGAYDVFLSILQVHGISIIEENASISESTKPTTSSTESVNSRSAS